MARLAKEPPRFVRAAQLRGELYVRRLRDELTTAYSRKHPRARIDVKRCNSVCVRILVIDPDFARKSLTARDDAVWEALDTLPEKLREEVSLLILLTPAEAKTSLMNRLEFEDLTFPQT